MPAGPRMVLVARRPMHPTRTSPGGPPGPGGRPAFGAARPGFWRASRLWCASPRRRWRRWSYSASRGGAASSESSSATAAWTPAVSQEDQGRPNEWLCAPRLAGGAQIPQEPVLITRTITVTEGISVKDLAEKLGVRGKDLIASLLMRGVFVTVNQSLDAELVKDVAAWLGPTPRSSPSRTRWPMRPQKPREG